MKDFHNENISIKKDRKKHLICGIIGICISVVLTGLIVQGRIWAVDRKVSEIQQELSKEVFRFHVLANSDSGEDQEVKLKVRDAVLSYMKAEMDGEKTAEATKAWTVTHLTDIEETARKVLREAGYSYGACAEVTTCYFPEKQYGDIVFPQGDYEALRIELGKAKGHNWWCVLYPNLCFMSTTCAVVSDEGKEELQDVLDDEEYEMITAASEFRIRWFFFGDHASEKDTEEK